MYTVLLPPGSNPIAVNRYIKYHIITTLGINEHSLILLGASFGSAQHWKTETYEWCAYEMQSSNKWQTDYTREHDFGTWKVYCISNVNFHAEFKYAIKIFPSPTVFVQW